MPAIHRYSSRNDTIHCAAPSCVEKKRIIDPRKGYYDISLQSRKDTITHCFHRNCLMLSLSQDLPFLKTGVLSKCPATALNCSCYPLIPNIFGDFPTREAVAKDAFRFHVEKGNFDKANQLLNMGLISAESIAWAEKQPGFKKVSAKSEISEDQLPKLTDERTQLTPTDSASISYKKMMQNVVHHEQILSLTENTLLKEFVKNNPKATTKQIQCYLDQTIGKEISEAYILQVIKSWGLD